MSLNNKDQLIREVDAALEEIRPFLKVDGGNIEVVDITEEMVVQVKWIGNCEMCNMSAMTMRAGIEEAVKGKIPGIKAIEAINGVAV